MGIKGRPFCRYCIGPTVLKRNIHPYLMQHSCCFSGVHYGDPTNSVRFGTGCLMKCFDCVLPSFYWNSSTEKRGSKAPLIGTIVPTDHQPAMTIFHGRRHLQTSSATAMEPPHSSGPRAGCVVLLNFFRLEPYFDLASLSHLLETRKTGEGSLIWQTGKCRRHAERAEVHLCQHELIDGKFDR
jgi:hypothetical protein